MQGSCFQCCVCAALRDLPVLPTFVTAAFGFCHPHKSDSGFCRETWEVPQPRHKLPGQAASAPPQVLAERCIGSTRIPGPESCVSQDGIWGTSCHGTRGAVCPAEAMSAEVAQQPLCTHFYRAAVPGCRVPAEEEGRRRLALVRSSVRCVQSRSGLQHTGGVPGEEARASPVCTHTRLWPCRVTMLTSPYNTNTEGKTCITTPQRTTMLTRL